MGARWLATITVKRLGHNYANSYEVYNSYIDCTFKKCEIVSDHLGHEYVKEYVNH